MISAPIQRSRLFPPVLADIMARRVESWAIVGAAAAQVGLTLLHLPGWSCPFYALLGIPCPGCGLTTATVHLLKGDWHGAMQLHAFAPVLVIVMTLILVGCILPVTSRQKLVEKVRWVEQKTGVSTVLLVGLLLYWGVRLLGLLQFTTAN